MTHHASHTARRHRLLTRPVALVVVVLSSLTVVVGCGVPSEPSTVVLDGSTAHACDAHPDCAAAPVVDPAGAELLVGQPAPALRGRDLVRGGDTDLAEFGCKPVAIVFWLNTCPHCQREMPMIERLAAELGPSVDVVSAAIVDPGRRSGPSGYATPAEAVATMHLTIPSVAVADSVARQQWHVGTVPTAFVLDGTLHVVHVVSYDDAAEVPFTQSVRDALAAVA